MDYSKEPFKDLTFDGRPGQYREFRRKVILAVAALEDKNQHLAGPKLLSRLQGEAWRCTEHLSIAEVRTKRGWLIVMDCLDKHHKHLPEVELHESIDDFLFHLKKKPNEGTTAFSARFKTALSRLENLIQQEREASRQKRRKRDDDHRRLTPASPVASSLEDSDAAESSHEADQTDDAEYVDPTGSPHAEPAATPTAAPAEEPDQPTQPAAADLPSQQVPSERGSGRGSHRTVKSSRKQMSSAGAYKADQERSLREMQRMLGTLEPSHRKPKPIFPQSVLGHLFMRKFGLNREQRTLVIRATGGSSRFLDVERILRASDLEDQKFDDRKQQRQFKPARRETFAVQQVDNESSSLEAPISDTDEDGDEIMIGEHDEDSHSDDDEQLAEVYEIQKKAKKDFKKSFRTYKESKKKVREIKKSRVGPSSYYPVVAVPPDSGSAPSGSQAPKPFKSDRREPFKKKEQKPSKPGGRREEANFTQTEVVASHFSYMVNENSDSSPTADEVDVFLASIPQGFAILDTGCTTSVIGESTAQELTRFFQEIGHPPPKEVQLPAVELKGFNGNIETSTKGLRWTVFLGKLQGQVTTYVIPGVTPFLLSRRVLEAMEAILDMKNHTITTAKHGFQDEPLRQASNGHLLLPLYMPKLDLEIDQCDHQNTNEPNVEVPPKVEPAEPKDHQSQKFQTHVCSPKCNHDSPLDKKRAFQKIVKNTKNGVIDIAQHSQGLAQVFGVKEGKIVHAQVAYKPKKERIPPHADVTPFDCSVASLELTGTLNVSPWRIRSPSPDRRPVAQMSVAIFAFAPGENPRVQSNATDEPIPDDCNAVDTPCFCCNTQDHVDLPQIGNTLSTEALYDEDFSWVDLDKHEEIPEDTSSRLLRSIESIRKASVRMTLSRLATNPNEVRNELASWLGDQAWKLKKPIGLIEVFTDKAKLSDVYEKQHPKYAIRLGLKFGQDFTRVHDRRCLLLLIAMTRPDHIWFSFPCKPWGPWTRLNMSKSNSTYQKIIKERAAARRYLHNVSEAWNLQCLLGGHAHAENPLSSLAWAELTLDDAWEIRVDQCAMGLRSANTDKPVLKPTRIVTTQASLATSLSTCRCDGRHEHEHLEGKYRGLNLTKWAEIYPLKFCKLVNKHLEESPQSKLSPKHHVEDVLAEDEGELEELEDELVGADSEGVLDQSSSLEMQRARALVHKVHVNTGHSSPEQLKRLALRCKSSPAILKAIKDFKCSVCDELSRPPSNRKATIQHAESPNQIVGVDYVQVELHREDASGKKHEIKRKVLTVVDLATEFCQQIVVPPGPYGFSKAFHSIWARPYGVPKTIFMDPDRRNISKDFQRYLVRHDIQLLLAPSESHWQLGKVEVANRILRNMAQRVWRAHPDASPEEIIESCATIRNEQLRRHGFSPVQWFLGRESRHAGSLHDVDEQRNFVTQSQVLDDPTFSGQMQLRYEASKAFIEEHAKDTWRRAVAGRNRPMRGPYVQGQLVYLYRKQGKGMLASRHGAWIGPGRIVGMESSRNSPIPRLIWVSFNGNLYRCSPEGLRPLPQDEAEFRQLSRELSVGQLSPDLARAEQHLRENRGQFIDLVPNNPEDNPQESDMELQEDVEEEPGQVISDSEGGPRKIRRRFYRSDEYWKERAAGRPPSGSLHEGPMPRVLNSMADLPSSAASSRDRPDASSPAEKKRRVEIDSDAEELSYEPTSPAETLPDDPLEDQPEAADSTANAESAAGSQPDNLSTENPPVPEVDQEMEESQRAVDTPVPMDDDDELQVTATKHSSHQVLEVSFNVNPEDITDDPLCLWGVIDECFEVTPKAKQRRVEVNFRKLSPTDKKLFEGAMKKEWNSWIENKVTSICRSKGIPAERIIKARWVLVWKKSSDPDDRSKTPKARLVLVGWQDPELGKVQTDSPTLRKETKHMILSICSSKRWKLWGADIKTAFLSGDPAQRDIYFRPPSEIKEWMNLSDQDLMRLEKAAYGLAEAPRAWFLRLTRELRAAGLVASKLDPCLFTLKKGNKLLGVCGVHVDDLIGGGTKEMDDVLNELRKHLPFGDYRTYTIRYTGIEIRQNPQTCAIEIGQETYIDALEPVPTRQYGSASTPLKDPSIMRTCAGQLAWVANATRPDQAFLASFLQGIQDKAEVSHLHMFNKAVRELKERRVCMYFPPGIPLEQHRILSISDAGFGTRANGDSQGGYLLCLTTPTMFERKRSPCWLIDWQSKKLRRVCRSSVAAETLAGQNGLDGIEAFQALWYETVYNVTPRQFREMTPEEPSGLVLDSKGFFDAVTRSCCSQAISQEKRLQIDYSIAKETAEKQNILIFWVNNLRMSADCLTKLKGDTKPLFEILETHTYEITICTQSGRKEKQEMLEK